MSSCAQHPALLLPSPLLQRTPRGHPLGQDPFAPNASSLGEHCPMAHRGHLPMAHWAPVGLQAQRCCFPAFTNTPDDNRRKKNQLLAGEKHISQPIAADGGCAPRRWLQTNGHQVLSTQHRAPSVGSGARSTQPCRGSVTPQLITKSN